jgi:hypothetical protein
MLSWIGSRMTYANVASTLALFFAVSGGAAFAASHYLITSSRQIKPGVLAQLKGKPGKPGKAGVAGAQGPAGPVGPAGVGGAKGETGGSGSDGANGVSVTATAASSGECKAGGVKLVSVSGATKVCNGAKGEPGPAGGTSETLPKGAIETGTWYAPPHEIAAEYAEISFTTPVEGGIEASHAHFISVSQASKHEYPEGCSGSASEPEAEDGYLCVFQGEVNLSAGTLLAEETRIRQPGPSEGKGAGPNGAVLALESEAAGAQFFGTWIVRAE